MRKRDGFTLIEATFAMALIAAACGAVATAVLAARAVGAQARHETIALVTARSRLAELTSLTFASTVTLAGEVLAVTDTSTDLARDPPGPGGSGLAPSPPDALDVDRAGSVDYLDDTGRRLGNDEGSRRRATYVRRWAIARLGSGAGEVASIAVLVAPAAEAARGGARLVDRPGVVVLRAAVARRPS